MQVAGVDEAGRGPLAGPVFAAAVILKPKTKLPGLTDSKKLTEKMREVLFELVTQRALAWGWGQASVEEIDKHNILQATFLAMKRAVAALSLRPDHILVDGNLAPDFGCSTETIVEGDLTERAISAASVIAKVMRDRVMVDLDTTYPGYGFAQHKGYGTPCHLEMLQKLGPCAIHRKSFMPVKLCLENREVFRSQISDLTVLADSA